MHQLQAARMPLHQVDAGNTAVVNLLEKLLEVRATLVPNPCLGEETAVGSALVDADAQVDVLSEAHGGETAQLSVEATADAHVERARIELPVHLLPAAADAACGQERGHAVADGLLHRCEALMSTVRSAPGINFS